MTSCHAQMLVKFPHAITPHNIYVISKLSKSWYIYIQSSNISQILDLQLPIFRSPCYEYTFVLFFQLIKFVNNYVNTFN